MQESIPFSPTDVRLAIIQFGVNVRIDLTFDDSTSTDFDALKQRVNSIERLTGTETNTAKALGTARRYFEQYERWVWKKGNERERERKRERELVEEKKRKIEKKEMKKKYEEKKDSDGRTDGRMDTSSTAHLNGYTQTSQQAVLSRAKVYRQDDNYFINSIFDTKMI